MAEPTKPADAKPADGKPADAKPAASKGPSFLIPLFVIAIAFAIAIGIGALYDERRSIEWFIQIIFRIGFPIAVVYLAFLFIKKKIDGH